MSRIKIEDLKSFCAQALVREGMSQAHAKTVAEVLSETDAFGTHSHGTKNLHAYIKKFRAGGIDIHGEPQIVADGISFAVVDAKKTLGMIPSVLAMGIACDKAEKTGIAIVTVKNSCHFGAAGYYANIAAKRGLIGVSMSNVDPNMTAPGARGMLLGNNPLSYAAPAVKTGSVFSGYRHEQRRFSQGGAGEKGRQADPGYVDRRQGRHADHRPEPLSR
jgi:LDH2 family malate/lactate/ureidoglycolate dehydrogenase